MSFVSHARRPLGSMAKAKESCAPGATKSSRCPPVCWRVTSASGRRPPANGSIVMRPQIQPSASYLEWICSYCRRTAVAAEAGQPSTTMRPSTETAMWQITRGRPAAGVIDRAFESEGACGRGLPRAIRGAGSTKEHPWSSGAGGSFSQSAVDHALRALGVALALHRDRRRCCVDLTQVVRRELDVDRAEVLFQAVDLRGARDGHDPRLLREHPRERELRGRHALPRRDGADQLDDRLVRLPVLRLEARHGVTEVARIERRRLVDLPGEETLAQWTEGDEADPELLERREDLLLRLAPPQRVLALQRRHRLHRVRAADRRCTRFGEAEVLHLPLGDQLPNRAGDVLDRHALVDAVLVVEVDRIDAEPAE